MFYKTQQRNKPTTVVALETKDLKDLSAIVLPEILLNIAHRQEALNQIKQILKNTKYFESLLVPLINQISTYYQNLPETNHSYYALPGGLLDHALQRTAAAARLFFEEAIVVDGNELSELQQLWLFTLLSASLLKGIGKLCVDYKVSLFNNQGEMVKVWNPLIDPMIAGGKYYNFAFEPDNIEHISLRRRITLMLAYALMPAEGFNWIASNKHALTVWLALLQDDLEGAQTLGAILIHADALAIQFYFDAFMIKHVAKRGKGGHRIGTFMDNAPKESSLGKEQLLGVEFLNWLREALASGELTINKQPLLVVPEGLLLSKELFQRFLQANPTHKLNWQTVQKGFLSLDLHGLNHEGESMVRFEHSATHQIQSGTLFLQYAIALPNSMYVQNVYTGLVSPSSALEFIHMAQFGHVFNQQQMGKKATALTRLNMKGEWIASDPKSATLSPIRKQNG